MDDETPTLRPRSLLGRLLSALVRILERHAEPCNAHCKCVTTLRREMAIIMAVFLLVIGALVRREVLSYVPPLSPAPPPIRSGARLPGLDPTK